MGKIKPSKNKVNSQKECLKKQEPSGITHEEFKKIAAKLGNKKRKREKKKQIIERPKHLKDVEHIVIHKRAEIIPSYSDIPSLKEDKPFVVLEQADDATGNIDRQIFISGKWRPWLEVYRKLGSDIRGFIETKDEALGAKIIEQDPLIVFGDGTEITLAMFLSEPQEPDSTLYSKQGFYNPFRELLFKWSTLTMFGIREERKRARHYLKKFGFTCFIQKPQVSNPWFIHFNSQFFVRVASTYEKTLRDIQEIFDKTIDKKDALMRYIEEKGIVDSLKSSFEKYHGKKTPYSKFFFSKYGSPPKHEEAKNKIVDILLNYYKAPNKIALQITSAIEGIGMRTVSDIYKLKGKR